MVSARSHAKTDSSPTLSSLVDDIDVLPSRQVGNVAVTDQRNQKRTWLGYLWDTADLSKEERRLLFKVDASLLIFASVSFYYVICITRTSAHHFFCLLAWIFFEESGPGVYIVIPTFHHTNAEHVSDER